MDSDLKENEIQDHKEGHSLKKDDEETIQKGTVSEQTEPSGDGVDNQSKESTLNHQFSSQNELDIEDSTEELDAGEL